MKLKKKDYAIIIVLSLILIVSLSYLFLIDKDKEDVLHELPKIDKNQTTFQDVVKENQNKESSSYCGDGYCDLIERAKNSCPKDCK